MRQWGSDSRGRKKRAKLSFRPRAIRGCPQTDRLRLSSVLTVGDARELPCGLATDGWTCPPHHRASIVRWVQPL